MRRFALLPARQPSARAITVSLLVVLAFAVSGCANTAGPQRVGRHPIREQYVAQSQDSRVQFIVLHYTETDFAKSLDILTQGPVSSHYLVDANPPRIYRLVPEDRRAWHAGKSSWRGQTGLNATSIGIEIVNDGNRGHLDGPFAPWDPAQIDAVVALVKDLARRHAVQPQLDDGHERVGQRDHLGRVGQRRQDRAALVSGLGAPSGNLADGPRAAEAPAGRLVHRADIDAWAGDTRRLGFDKADDVERHDRL
jgi:hypothetical protein